MALDPRLAAAVAALREGRDPGWLAWRRIRESDEPEVLDALLVQVASGPFNGLQLKVLPALQSAAGRSDGLAVLQAPERAAAILGAYVALPPRLADYGAEPDTVNAAIVLRAFDEMIPRLGAVLLGAARQLVDGPATPLSTYLDAQSLALRPSGARLAGLGVLTRHGDGADVRRLARVVRDPTEESWHRVEAAVGWHGLAGPSTVATIVETCGNLSKVAPWDYGDYAARLAKVGADLVPWMVGRLDDPDYTVRHRAVTLLAHIGPPAVAALTELVRETDDWRELENAREALGSISPAALRHALHERETMDRGLSLVDDEPGPERGISPAEAPDA